MAKSPTDKRIDDLSGRVGRFEANVDARFDKVDRGFGRFEDKVDKRFDKIATKEQLGMLDARFDRWGKIVSGGTVTIVAAVVLKVLGA
jgi:hypothetical protein